MVPGAAHMPHLKGALRPLEHRWPDQLIQPHLVHVNDPEDRSSRISEVLGIMIEQCPTNNKRK